MLHNIYDTEEIGYVIDEMKKKTIWMTDEEYEDEPYPNFEHDPYQYIKNNKNDDYGIMDALDGEPDAYWNID